MASPKCSLILGLLALMSLHSLTEARPHPDDLGIVLGPHEYPDDLGTILGPHEYPDDLGTVIGPHEFVDPPMAITRKSFPEDFIFGTSVSAYQVEGAKKGSGRGLTTWDEFTHMFPDKVKNDTDGDIAVDFYDRYKEDIKLMKELNTNGFRFSISWTRVLPYGRRLKNGEKENIGSAKNEENEKDGITKEGVNLKGVDFYNRLINELIANGIQPAITLFHWESPLDLEKEYGGFLDKRMVEDFRDFANFCFETFGDRVKNWATFNEPSVYSVAGYSKGKKAPGRCSDYIDKNCIPGDSSTHPYTVAHNEILAHLAAVEEFRKCVKCQEGGGKIGIVLVSHWFEPKSPNSLQDQVAANRSLEFQLGWFMHPLTHGDYPPTMKSSVRERLPRFTKEESERLKKSSLDFVGLNYYGAFFATKNDQVDGTLASYGTDLRTNWTAEQKESPHLKNTSMGIVIFPLGLRKILTHIKEEYNDPEIYIMENGMDEIDYGTKTLDQALADKGRREFIRSHILILGKAINLDHVKVKGYFIWSLLDNFEWNHGYGTRFGLYYVDYNNGLKRHMRSSGEWLREFLSTDMRLEICYFESHREKGYPPELFPVELIDPDERLRYATDFM